MSEPTELEELEDDAQDTESLDYVSFEMQGEMYAFPMARVQEIIRLPEVVKVPLGPDSLEGLANLRGRVLPVVSLRRCCGLADAEHDEATRVVVVDGGATLGFVVDRVASVTSVAPDRVEPADTVRATVRSELLAGVVKSEDAEGPMTTVLDVPALVAAEFTTLKRAAAEGRGRTAAAVDGVGAVDETTDTLELVSFAVDGQEYALPIDQVQEIVQAPEAVSSVPNAEARVLGVMDLRGRLLPVVSLRRVFGLPAGPLEPQNRIVVVSLDDGSVVGVVMDTVREVLRVPQDLVAPLPPIVSGRSGRSEVEQVCRLEDGERLVSVLSVERMFGGGLREALEAVVEDDPALLEETEELDVTDRSGDGRGEDELLVVFRVADEEYCVDVDAVQEIIRVPQALSRVPKTLDFVEGLVNLRGAVLPVVDLRSRLGLARCERDERQRIVVFVLDGVRTGFIVDAVAEVLKVSATTLEPAPELSEEQARLVARVANLPESDRMLMVLEPGELLVQEQVDALLPVQRRSVDELAEA